MIPGLAQQVIGRGKVCHGLIAGLAQQVLGRVAIA